MTVVPFVSPVRSNSFLKLFVLDWLFLGRFEILRQCDFEFRISSFKFRTDSSEKSNASVLFLSSYAIFAPALPWGRLLCFLARVIMHRSTMVPTTSTRSRRAFGWIDPTVRPCDVQFQIRNLKLKCGRIVCNSLCVNLNSAIHQPLDGKAFALYD